MGEIIKQSGKTRRVQFLTRGKLGEQKVESFEIDSNRLPPTEYFSDFAERFVFPTPSVQGFLAHTALLTGVGSLAGNVALSSSVGLLATSVLAFPFILIGGFLLCYRGDLKPALAFYLTPLFVGLVLGVAAPEVSQRVEGDLPSVISQ
jgi:hypothetical protein